MAQSTQVSMTYRFRVPGGEFVVELNCPYPGCLPHAFILSEPSEPTPELGRLRAQVELVNALRKFNKRRYIQLIVDADKGCHDLLLPALALIDVPAARKAEAAA